MPRTKSSFFEYQTSLKIVLDGNSQSGKTALAKCFEACFSNKPREFSHEYRPTIGVDLRTSSDDYYKYQIWDTAGQQNHSRSPDITYYRDAAAIFLTFRLDLATNVLESVVRWQLLTVQTQLNNLPKPPLVYFVGTKADLLHPELLEKHLKTLGRLLLESKNVEPYIFKTSAKTEVYEEFHVTPNKKGEPTLVSTSQPGILNNGANPLLNRVKETLDNHDKLNQKINDVIQRLREEKSGCSCFGGFFQKMTTEEKIKKIETAKASGDLNDLKKALAKNRSWLGFLFGRKATSYQEVVKEFPDIFRSARNG